MKSDRCRNHRWRTYNRFHQSLGKASAHELQRRDIDRDRHKADPLIHPSSHLKAGVFKDPLSELFNKPGLFGGLDNRERTNGAIPRMVEAQQSFK